MPSSAGVHWSSPPHPWKTSLKEFHLHAGSPMYSAAECAQLLTFPARHVHACTHSAFKISLQQQQQQQQNIIMWSHPSHNLISNPTIKSPQIFTLVSKAQHEQLMPSATAFSNVEWHLGSKSALKAIH